MSKIRIIVSPNGSGKSTIKKILSDIYKIDFGYFINADEIERLFNKDHSINNVLGIIQSEMTAFLKKHTLNKKFPLTTFISKIKCSPKLFSISKYKINSYEASAFADLLRHFSLIKKIKFSFESVFSDESKIDFVKKLKKENYKIYIYVISTLNPEINKSRVRQRLKNNGHHVPEKKIEERYYKSLINIKKIIALSYRCFIIDNSQELSPILISEVSHGKTLNYLNQNYQPNWAKKLINL